jgi:AcrR family transcriptional regulator
MTGRGSARAKLMAAAAARFYAGGVAATGIDVITADAGVAKMSLYNNFSSKADLVAAYLDQRQQEFRALHRRRVEALPADAGPGARALAVFDAYVEHAEAVEGFRGCGLLNVAGELPTGDPGRAAVARGPRAPRRGRRARRAPVAAARGRHGARRAGGRHRAPAPGPPARGRPARDAPREGHR